MPDNGLCVFEQNSGNPEQVTVSHLHVSMGHVMLEQSLCNKTSQIGPRILSQVLVARVGTSNFTDALGG